MKRLSKKGYSRLERDRIAVIHDDQRILWVPELPFLAKSSEESGMRIAFSKSPFSGSTCIQLGDHVVLN